MGFAARVVFGISALFLVACGPGGDGASAPTIAPQTAPPTAVPATPTAAPIYRDACIGLADVKKGMWGAADNAFTAATSRAEAAVSRGDVSQLPVAQDFLALASDSAQVSLAQLQGTSDAKALAQFNADLPLYSQYFVGCSGAS